MPWGLLGVERFGREPAARVARQRARRAPDDAAGNIDVLVTPAISLPLARSNSVLALETEELFVCVAPTHLSKQLCAAAVFGGEMTIKHMRSHSHA